VHPPNLGTRAKFEARVWGTGHERRAGPSVEAAKRADARKAYELQMTQPMGRRSPKGFHYA